MERVLLRSIRELYNTEEELVKHIVRDLPSMGKDLGFEIDGIDKEVRIEGFLADRVVRCKNGEVIVVEVQLGESNHDHVGKLLTYVANKGANRGYLICEIARQEHVNTLSVFGQGKLHLVEVYLVGDTTLAYRLALPRKPRKEFIGRKTELNRLEFWQGFKSYAINMGLVELENKNLPRMPDWWLVLFGIRNIYRVFKVDSNRCQVWLATPKDSMMDYFRSWKTKINYDEFKSRKDVVAFIWNSERLDSSMDNKNWPEFYKAMMELHTKSLNACQEFLGYFGRSKDEN